MKKLIALVLAILMFAMLAAACTTGAPADTEKTDVPEKTDVSETEEFDPKEYSLAVCMGSMSHPVHRQIQLGFINTAVELGYNTPDIIGTDGPDQSEQFAAAEKWAANVEAGKGAMLLWNGDHSSDELCAKLGKAGIFVGMPHFRIFVDDEIENGLPEGICFEMACNPETYARKVARLAAAALDGKTGSFALTENTKGIIFDPTLEYFVDEWNKLASDYKLDGIKVLDIQIEGGDLEEATQIVYGIIKANEDIIGAFGTTGNSPQAWANAAEKAGKGVGDIWIAGMDATETNLQYVKDGKVQVLVAQPLVQEASKTAEYFDKMFRGEDVPIWTDIDSGIITRDSTGENSIDTWKNYIKATEEMFSE